MKKLLTLMLTLVMVAAMAIPSSAAATGELIWFDDFSNAAARNYNSDYYDVQITDGKLSIMPLEPSKFPLYQLPGTDKVTGNTGYTMAITFTYSMYANQSVLGLGFGGADTENYFMAGINTAKATGAQRYWAHIDMAGIKDLEQTAAQGKDVYSRGYNVFYVDADAPKEELVGVTFAKEQEYTLVVEVNGNAVPEIYIYKDGVPVAFENSAPEAYMFDTDTRFTTDGLIGLVMSKSVVVDIDALGVWSGVGLDRDVLLGKLAGTEKSEGTVPVSAETTEAPVTTAAPVETTAAPVTTAAPETTTAPAATPSTADGSLVLFVAAAGVLTVCILSARRRRT